jgi:hypothetical protein
MIQHFGISFDPILTLIKARMMPDYWIECLYSEGTGCDWTAPIHKINQKWKAYCHWFEETKMRGRWRVHSLNKVEGTLTEQGGGCTY